MRAPTEIVASDQPFANMPHGVGDDVHGRRTTYRKTTEAALRRSQLAREPTLSRLQWIDWSWALLASHPIAFWAFVLPKFRLRAVRGYSGQHHPDAAVLANWTLQRARKQHGSAPKGARSVILQDAAPPRVVSADVFVGGVLCTLSAWVMWNKPLHGSG